jgi:hypothetical protein
MRRLVRKSTRAGLRDARILLQQVLVAELMAPGRRLHLRSPWITDVAVIDNRGGRFDPLFPDIGQREIVLSEILGVLAAAGTQVAVECRLDDINRPFLLAVRRSEAIRVFTNDDLHEKLLALDDCILSGSMNFTAAGLDRNDEQLSIDTDAAVVARVWVELESARR